jgi:RNA polymerase sigma-70 factor (ECF subfamily)
MESETTLPPALLSFAARPAAADLEALVTEHRQMVYRIAFSVLRNATEAEEASQDTFLKVIRAAGRLAAVDDPKAWIARIAWNAALDRRRQSRPGLETPLEELAAGVNGLRDSGRTPEEIAAGSEMQRLLSQLIRALPDKLRDAITLATVEELSYAEVAAALGTSEAAVRARVFQARQILKEKLDRLLGVRL